MEEMNGVFRTTAFGGFNKEDVLGFIEMQKRVEADLRAATESLDTRLRSLSDQLEKTVAEKNEAEDQLAENQAAKEAASALAIKEAEYKSLENKYSVLKQSNDAMAEENAALRKKMLELQNKISDAEQKQEAAVQVSQKSIEEQVGSAFIDARRFADQIISEAKNTATAVNEKTLRMITDANEKTALISAELQLCAEKCAKLFAEIDSEMDSIKKELAKTADIRTTENCFG